MATTRAKFRCVLVTQKQGYGKFPILTDFDFSPVMPVANDPEHENTKFWEASPNGLLKLTTTMLPVDHFKLGEEYYLTLTPAKEENDGN